MVISLLIVALTPPPPLQPRLVTDGEMRCDMHASDGARTGLRIGLRAENHLVNGREEPRYRWTIEGDEVRYPPPLRRLQMYSNEDVRTDRSWINVNKDGVNYTYRLHYDGNIDGRSPTRAHLLIERWRAGSNTVVEPIGIGLCTITPTEAEQ